MLKINENISIEGESIVDGVTVERYRASISKNAPNDLSIRPSITVKKELRKENREECRADRTEFEELVYARQDELIKEQEEEE